MKSMKALYQRRNQRNEEQGEGGFTLVELLVVIIIIGILAAVAVFAVSGITDRGQDSACDADRRTVEVAVEAYYANHDPGIYPANEQALVDEGYLKALSKWHTVGASDGVVTHTEPKCAPSA